MGGGSVKSDVYDDAVEAYLSDRFTEAAAGFEAVLALEPDHEDAREMAANARRALGDRDRAESHERLLAEVRARRHAREAAGDLAAEPPAEQGGNAGDMGPALALVLRSTFVIGSTFLILLAGAALAVAREEIVYFLGALVAALLVAAVGGAELAQSRRTREVKGLAWELAGFAAAFAALGLLALTWFQGPHNATLAIAIITATLILGGYVTLQTISRKRA